MKESTNRKMYPCTVQKTAKWTTKWMELKLLTYAVRARLKMVNDVREKKAQNKNVRTKQKSTQLSERKVKIGLEKERA